MKAQQLISKYNLFLSPDGQNVGTHQKPSKEEIQELKNMKDEIIFILTQQQKEEEKMREKRIERILNNEEKIKFQLIGYDFPYWSANIDEGDLEQIVGKIYEKEGLRNPLYFSMGVAYSKQLNSINIEIFPSVYDEKNRKKIIELSIYDIINLDIKKKKQKKEKIKKQEKEKFERILKIAKEKNEDQILDQITIDCDGTVPECSFDNIITYITPNGETYTKQFHCH
jgi:hypothetical protein